MTTFAYAARNPDGQTVRGTIEAESLDSATQQLKAMSLHVLDLKLAPTVPGRPLTGADFVAFNQQLAQLTAAGLPVEHGLRLIAGDLRSGRLKRTVESIAQQLEQGQSLDQAFKAHQGQFQPMYAEIVEAGIRSGNLPGVLLGLGRHLDTTRRLRTELVRAIAYPLMILLAVGIVLVFMGQTVFPQIVRAYESIRRSGRMDSFYWWRPDELPDTSLPWITLGAYYVANVTGVVLIVVSLLALAVPLLWQAVPGSRLSRWADSLLMRAPLVGPVLRKSLTSRWLDALSVAVSAGLDLPRAIDLAGSSAASPGLAEDSRRLHDAVAAGQPLDSAAASMRFLPQALPAVLQVAAEARALPETLASLAESHQQQADQRITLIPTTLTPLLMTLIAVVIGSLMLSLLAPMAKLLNWLIVITL